MQRQTSHLRRLFERRVVLMINIAVLGFLLLNVGREYVRNASVEHQISALRKEQQELQTKNLEIFSLSQRVQTEYFLEKEGRLKYGLRRPGEQLVVLTDPSSSRADGVSPAGSLDSLTDTPATETSRMNPQRWWNFLFNPEAYQRMKDQYGSSGT